MQGITQEGDVHVAGNMRVAWFKDTDGKHRRIYDNGIGLSSFD
jgi:hypothetical protein